jgi:hypothetical protein
VPYQNYQLLEAERSKTVADLRTADVQRGEFAAAVFRSFRAAAAQIRDLAVLPRFRSSARPACADCNHT